MSFAANLHAVESKVNEFPRSPLLVTQIKSKLGHRAQTGRTLIA
jgi:hypothetical protein